MALQGAVRSALSINYAKLFGGSLTRFGAAAQGQTFATSAGETTAQEQKSQGSLFQDVLRQERAKEFLDKLNMNAPAHLLARKDEDAQQPTASPASPAALMAMSGIPARTHGMSLLRRRAGLPLANRAHAMPQAHQLMSSRHYTAWSPAQRYFVEGDHVVQAELNRTFQFTGLDAGSFYPFVIYTAVATVIATAFMVIPLLVAPSRVDLDKSSAYECGFDAFGEARQTFSVSFYLVSIMYLLFDIEIAYLLPYVMSHANTSMFWTMNLFLSLLVVGFVYEWGVGALEWRE
mmetsp:Transcript_12465/g.26882  ORF Transcript_12465/g.26882 Transcript_12465/m.26882 type:complete len:290 (+) Transcript_12465:55-924(+)|eukprot:CAMPEP_0202899886 /NCGR_PEP_ID=MMETSP1392-20130828/9172_1 /ASSEMBLY_ACC=CAM_ASM_000868 /TAXON_ID=225041 /ORGANISM="Chlamydomonas chlamydogama, Strain SAG 11-48b" /LENGTH=289 /DNA_ID=CAMNT_0049586181 /DNA_START=55 /DNA_END=924 /DNA_ORIENTATION=+